MNSRYILMFLFTTYAISGCATEGDWYRKDSIVGKYAFDWFKDPAEQQCFKLSKKNIKVVKKCNIAAEGSNAVAICRINSNSEWLVFTSKDLCHNAKLEMEANAP